MLVNPYREPGMERYWVPSSLDSALFGTDITDYWFPVAQGGDIAFLYGVLKILIENGWVRSTSSSRSTPPDFDELEAAASRTLDLAELEAAAGLPRAGMQEFAELIRDAKNAVLRLEHGHHAARLRRRCRADDPESRPRAEATSAATNAA